MSTPTVIKISSATTPTFNVTSSTPTIRVRSTVAGGGSGGPGSLIHEHTQSVAATVWTINHVLQYRPNVHVVDTSGEQLHPTIDHASATQIVITHGKAYAGAAYLS